MEGKLFAMSQPWEEEWEKTVKSGKNFGESEKGEIIVIIESYNKPYHSYRKI